MVARDNSRPPIHPGEILHEDVLPGLGMSVTAAAGHLRVTPQALHRVLAGSAAVSPEMALRVGKFCGNGAESLAADAGCLRSLARSKGACRGDCHHSEQSAV